MIPVTWRASSGYLLRHPWQLLLSMIGIGIGVAVIVAVDLANASARTAFLLSMDAVSGEATHQVVGGPRGIDEDVYAELRTRAGLTNIAPVVDGPAASAGIDIQVLGIDLFAEPAVRTFTSPAASVEGVSAQSLFRLFLARPGAATMSADTAARLGLAVGEAFTVQSGGRAHDAELIGIFDAAALDNIVVVDIATAQEWLGSVGWLTRIDVRIDDGDAATLDRLEASLPPGARLLSAAGRTQTTADLSRAFMTNLAAMSLLALLVGLFLIYNSVSFSVLQRRHLIGVLRALGMTRRQVVALVLGEAATLGLVAAGAGVVLGIALGEQLLALVTRSINDLYFRVSVTDVSVDAFTISKGMLAGVGAALAAAAVPALEATGYRPQLALARSTLERRTRNMLPAVALLGVATMLVAATTLLVSGKNLVAGLTAVFLLILGFALCVPLAIRAITTWSAPRIGRIGRTVTRLAVSGVAAGLSRTGVAVVALAVAVSATIGVSVMVDSFRGSVDRWLTQTLQADVYVGVQRGALDRDIINDIARLPAVDAFSTSRRAWIEDESGRTQVVAIAMAPGSYAGTTILDRDPADVWPVWERDDAVLVSEPYAYRNDVAPDDKLELRTDQGVRGFTILATYQSYDINANAVLMSRGTYDRLFDDDGVDSIGLYLAPGSDIDALMRTIVSVGAGRQELTVNSNARIRQLSLEIFDQTFVITDVLYWLATGVALIGILASMLALQLQNGREQGVLRALGMTPGQIGSMITLQTGVIGLLSGVFALPLGVVMAWVLIEVINRRAFGWQIDMVVAPDILLTAVAFAVSAAVLAGLYPAWRAGRTQPAIAMREE